MSELDGVWKVERVGGLLPPLIGVRKHIDGTRGVTRVGPFRLAFSVVGRTLRYDWPFEGFADVLDGAGDRLSGRSLFHGREFGRFRMLSLDEA